MMNNIEGRHTKKLQMFLNGFFENLGIEAYYFEASAEANFPYIVYELRHIGSASDAEGSKRYVMEVNAYNKNDLFVLDDLIDLLEIKLDNYQANVSDFFLCTNLAYGRIDIQEKDPLKRKRVNFELKYFERK